ncbi:dihydrofolate reductase [Hydrogenophilus thermoluteolus]|uniref:dihydrofolate reductase n=1 Tax=Hydrogenophilus thermoluteolus TaxID=297 RepID=UPI003F670FD0
MSEIVIIAAVGRNGELGYRNALPWHLPDDLKRFKQLTLGAPVVMGRNTWHSLGRPLPGRTNVVVSRTLARSQTDAAPTEREPESTLPSGVRCFPTLEAALAALAKAPTVFVIGGAQLYAAALPFADRLELTEVDAAPPADAFFPAWPRSDFVAVARTTHPADANHAYPFAFVTYRRVQSRTQST